MCVMAFVLVLVRAYCARPAGRARTMAEGGAEEQTKKNKQHRKRDRQRDVVVVVVVAELPER